MVLAARAQLLTTLAEPEPQRDWKKVDAALQAAPQPAMSNRSIASSSSARRNRTSTRQSGRWRTDLLMAEMSRRLPNPERPMRPPCGSPSPTWPAAAAIRAGPSLCWPMARNRIRRSSAAIRMRTIRSPCESSDAGRRRCAPAACRRRSRCLLAGRTRQDSPRTGRRLDSARRTIGCGCGGWARGRAGATCGDLRTRSKQFDLAIERRRVDEARRLLDEMRNLEGPQGTVVPERSRRSFAPRPPTSATLEALLKQVDSGSAPQATAWPGPRQGGASRTPARRPPPSSTICRPLWTAASARRTADRPTRATAGRRGSTRRSELPRWRCWSGRGRCTSRSLAQCRSISSCCWR